MGADVTGDGSNESDEERSDRTDKGDRADRTDKGDRADRTDKGARADRAGSGTRPITEAILLCGGRGTRLGGDVEKPLVEVDGVATVDRVLDALADSRVERVVAVSSPHTPETTRHLRDRATTRHLRDRASTPTDRFGIALDVRVGDGDGYVADLDHGLDAVDGPAVTVVSDLPLLRGADVDDAIDAAVTEEGTNSADGANSADEAVSSVTVCVPAETKRELGVSVDSAFDHEGTTLAPTGLNVVADARDRIVVRRRRSLAVNVNRPGDLVVARRLARCRDGSTS